jgi:hypothetical protein
MLILPLSVVVIYCASSVFVALMIVLLFVFLFNYFTKQGFIMKSNLMCFFNLCFLFSIGTSVCMCPENLNPFVQGGVLQCVTPKKKQKKIDPPDAPRKNKLSRLNIFFFELVNEDCKKKLPVSHLFSDLTVEAIMNNTSSTIKGHYIKNNNQQLKLSFLEFNVKEQKNNVVLDGRIKDITNAMNNYLQINKYNVCDSTTCDLIVWS